MLESFENISAVYNLTLISWHTKLRKIEGESERQRHSERERERERERDHITYRHKPG